jgi:predicted DCC family thiol-disulfide oxidoreductase YuxK
MDKSKHNVNKLQVYYDGLCKVCSFEIEHYKKQKGAENINFVDITLADFNAEKEGLNPLLVHKYLHAKNEEGQIVSGVETFRLIWQNLPKYNWAFQFSKNKLVSSSLNLGYQFFVQVRPYLPRYKDQCKDSPYCEVKHT